MRIDFPADGLRDGPVALTHYRHEDAPLVAAGATDPLVVEFANVPWGSEPVAAIEERITETWPTLAADGQSANLAIRDDSTEMYLGHFVAFGFVWRDGRAEVGFWLSPAGRGRGAATTAVRLFTRWAFENLDLHRLQATTFEDNRASQAVLERAGFVQEGRLRSYYPRPDGSRTDAIMFSLLRTETG
jgi:RimJ/RimL family protein N-acetyltransferase